MEVTTLQWITVASSLFLFAFLVACYLWLSLKRRKKFWHHAVRLPLKPQKTHWYVITLSVGCRPWAGHEGDVYIKLIGTKGQSRTFLINGEVHSRLNEAETHMHLHATQWPLGDILHVVVVCECSVRKKRWFLSSVTVQPVTYGGCQNKKWYFPYHEWIEVFLEPVKVTLSCVHPDSDISRRIILGWLSRSLSEYHLWTSQCFSLKYSNFSRPFRFLCSSCHIITSISVTLLVNWLIPHLGPVVLGVYTSSIASLPVYAGEMYLRGLGKSPQLVYEDADWYQGQLPEKPSELKPHSALPCHISSKDDKDRLEEYKKFINIQNDENEFWDWMAAGADHVTEWTAQDIDLLQTQPNRDNIDTKQSNNNPSSREPGRFRRAVGKVGHSMAVIKRRMSRLRPEDSRVNLEQNESTPFVFPSFESIIQPTHKEDAEVLELNIADVIKNVMQVDVGKDGFFVNPTSVWKVDSSFSIDSLNMGRLDFKRFKTMESMPVSEFDKLRKGRRALLLSGGESQPTKASAGAIAELMSRNILKEVSVIEKPKSLENLTREEIELVGMIYFDLATGGQQWTKPGIPDDAYLTSHENIFVHESMLKNFPEPLPKQRIFSMMLFPEYAAKLTQAYRDMKSHRDMFTSVGELFSIFGESEKGSELFVRFCIVVSTSETGRKAFHDVISLTRNTHEWELLICDVTTRLKYQSDNVLRIQEKYGDFGTNDANISGSGVENPLERELLKIRHWCDKVTDLGIPPRDCPLAPLHKRDLKRLSRFYRFMLQSQDGAVLFGEILLQIASSGGEGLDVIRRMINNISSREEGVTRLIDLHGEVASSGREGRFLLLQLYKGVKSHSMCGSKVLSRLAEHANEVRAGKMLIADLQADGRRGHTVAREIKRNIHNHLNPIVQKCGRNISHVIIRFNSMARFIMEAVDHARMVVEDHDDDTDLIHPNTTKANQSLEDFDENKPPWKSCNVCCRHGDKSIKIPPPNEKSEDFRWTPTESDVSCEQNKSDFVLSDVLKVDDVKPKETNMTKTDEQKRMLKGILCRANLQQNRNEFYLQSRDYDKFYLSFDYKPRPEIQPKPQPTIKDVANKWGRKVSDLPQRDVITNDVDIITEENVVLPPAPRQMEHNVSCNGCIICALADKLTHVTNSRDMVDVMTDYVTKIPKPSKGMDVETNSLSTGIPIPSAGCDVTSRGNDAIIFRYEIKQEDDDDVSADRSPRDQNWNEFITFDDEHKSEKSDSFYSATKERLLHQQSNKPIVTKLFKNNWLKESCDLHKLPKFNCCDEMCKPSFPLECLCKRTEPLEDRGMTSPPPPTRKVCENEKVYIGTQQRPPCPRYLHPLKAFRCFEQTGSTCDSGISLYTAYDVDSNDVIPVKANEQHVLMELMGIRETQLSDNEGSVAPSSDACCHVRKARQVPLLHLQGYCCDTMLHNDIKTAKQLDADWWRRHDVALLGVQRCVDECVRSRGLMARSKEEAIGAHEKSCTVCGGSDVFGSQLVTRYSEMLPVLWRPTIRELGENLKNSNKEKHRMSFYRQLIQCAVQSTRTILFAPDLPPNQLDSTGAIVTSYHVTKLAHFREMMNSFNKLMDEVLTLKREFPSKYHDITQEFDTASNVMTDFGNSGKVAKEQTMFDLVVKFIETKLCGSVFDCTEALEAPWELPVQEQQMAGKFLNKLITSLQSKPGCDLPLDGALEFCLRECLNEIVKNASDQTCVMRAIDQCNQAKQYLANISVLTSLSVRRLLRFSEVVDSSMKNTRELMKRCLEDLDDVEEDDWWKKMEATSTSSVRDHISSLLHTGHDVSSCTIDDVLIDFERIRNWIRFDMKLSNKECDAIKDLRDDMVDDVIRRRLGDTKHGGSYDVWTESEAALRDDVTNLMENSGDERQNVNIWSNWSEEETNDDSSSTSHVETTSSNEDVMFPDLSMGPHDVKSDEISTDRISFVTCASDLEKNPKHVTFCLDEDPPAPSCGGAKEEFIEDLKQAGKEETEVATKEALKTNTGREMLKEIFGVTLTPKQMTEAYQSNIATLLSLFPSKSKYSHIGSFFAQTLLFVFCAGSVAFSCFYAFTAIGPADHVILGALPIAIIVFGLIIEPCKCVVVVWSLFISRRNPVFPVHPLFIQTDPKMLQRLTALTSSNERVERSDAHWLSNANDYDRAIYQQYCKNKRRPGLPRKRRRKVPALGGSDVPIEKDAASSGEIDEALFIPRKVAPPPQPHYHAMAGFRRTGVDLGVHRHQPDGGFRRGGVDVGGVRKGGVDRSKGGGDDVGEGKGEDPETPRRTRIVWCNLVPEEERNQ